MQVTWPNHTSCLWSGLKALRKDKSFFDLTLVDDEGKMWKAHKVVLVAASIYFKKALESLDPISCCNHVVMVLRSVSSSSMDMLLKFIYEGCIDLPQQALAGFMDLANSFGLRGFENIRKQNNNKNNVLKDVYEAEKENMLSSDTLRSTWSEPAYVSVEELEQRRRWRMGHQNLSQINFESKKSRNVNKMCNKEEFLFKRPLPRTPSRPDSGFREEQTDNNEDNKDNNIMMDNKEDNEDNDKNEENKDNNNEYSPKPDELSRAAAIRQPIFRRRRDR